MNHTTNNNDDDSLQSILAKMRKLVGGDGMIDPDTGVIVNLARNPEDASRDRLHPTMFAGLACELAPPVLTAAAQDVLDRFPDPPRLAAWNNPGVNAYYGIADVVYMSTRQCEDEMDRRCGILYGVDGTREDQELHAIVHELAHATGAPKRLDRPTLFLQQRGRAPSMRDKAMEEVVAELTAQRVLDALGKNNNAMMRFGDMHLFDLYDQFWQNTKTPAAKVIAEAEPMVKAAVDYMLSGRTRIPLEIVRTGRRLAA